MTQPNKQQIFERLGAPFREDEIEWRAQTTIAANNGKPPKALVVPYVQSRAIMNRLDEVVGWDKWENTVQELPGGGILQGIRIWISDNQSITKWDGADRTNMEATKGGISSAFKRAAVLFNIGRYLYSAEAKWVEITPNRTTQKDEYIQDKKKDIYGYFTPPSMNNGNRNVNNSHERVSSASRNQAPNVQPQTTEIPAGMFECTYQGKLLQESESGPYMEVWLKSNGDIACLYAIGETINKIESLFLVEGETIAVGSRVDKQGRFIVTDLIRLSQVA